MSGTVADIFCKSVGEFPEWHLAKVMQVIYNAHISRSHYTLINTSKEYQMVLWPWKSGSDSMIQRLFSTRQKTPTNIWLLSEMFFWSALVNETWVKTLIYSSLFLVLFQHDVVMQIEFAGIGVQIAMNRNLCIP